MLKKQENKSVLKIDDFTLNTALKKTISEINALDVLIFYLRIYKNFTLQEISDRLVISDECIRKRLLKIFVIAKKHIMKDIKQ